MQQDPIQCLPTSSASISTSQVSQSLPNYATLNELQSCEDVHDPNYEYTDPEGYYTCVSNNTNEENSNNTYQPVLRDNSLYQPTGVTQSNQEPNYAEIRWSTEESMEGMNDNSPVLMRDNSLYESSFNDPNAPPAVPSKRFNDLPEYAQVQKKPTERHKLCKTQER